jgi:cell division septation protein DedD
MADDRTRGVHLTDKQLVFVVMAATVVAGVVFLFGVLVGRGVPAGRAAGEGAMMTPTQVVSDGGDDAVSPAPPPVDAAGAAGTSGTAQAGRAAPPLSYAERLGKTPPVDRLTPAVANPPAAAPPENTPPDIAEEVGSAPGAPAGSALDAPYTVQVTVVKKRSEADAIVKSLKTKGFEARIFVPDGGDKLGVLRVRVGEFKTKKEADAIAQRIARETRYKQPWVTR